ncbi:hypothetical protein IWQ60_002954 [Tieghemiomyces parasiticus]|uniref:Uncharacterized protein n=1 Tax=Tieghemiomyces parasiticus TaxID=78921 RepID=A0A9W8E0M5_9FUNG|nr:hypothetical protein IWQ60_002954 [Tieghemiomyces parasiticus]
MYITRFVTVTALISVAAISFGQASSTLPLQYSTAGDNHQQLVRRQALGSLSAFGAQVQHLDRRAPKKNKRHRRKNKKSKKSKKRHNKDNEVEDSPDNSIDANTPEAAVDDNSASVGSVDNPSAAPTADTSASGTGSE